MALPGGCIFDPDRNEIQKIFSTLSGEQRYKALQEYIAGFVPRVYNFEHMIMEIAGFFQDEQDAAYKAKMKLWNDAAESLWCVFDSTPESDRESAMNLYVDTIEDPDLKSQLTLLSQSWIKSS